jgi:hypothetical protein
MFPSPLNHYLDTSAVLVLLRSNYTSHTHGIILEHGRKVRVRHHSIKRAVNLRRNLPNDLEIVDRTFEPARFHEAAELGRLWE